MKKLSLTERKVIEMLKENTGSHFLDSGGAYGRHHERNRMINFPSTPRTYLRFSAYKDDTVEIESTINLYHWLTDNLEYSPEMQRKFNTMVKTCDDDMCWLELADNFPDYLKTKGHEVTGLYREGDPIVDNTYNHESMLSQVIQFIYMEVDDIPYVILQIHNGCDVRGGYTAPKIFTTRDDSTIIFDDARGYIYCEHDHRWYTDNAGYNYYSDDNDIKLENYPCVELEEPPVSDNKHPDLFNEEDTFVGDYKYKNMLVICGGKGYCPICGSELSLVY